MRSIARRGSTFLITAGPTREYIDPVRFLSNPSSGKMGYAIARVAKEVGSRVILVSGPVDLKPPKGVRTIQVESAGEMYREVMRYFPMADIVIMAAAVSDYRPAKQSKKKMKKGSGTISIKMVRNPDILAALGKKKGGKILVGFAAETGSLILEAKRKLKNKNLDLIVANDVSKEGIGFGSDYNSAILIHRTGRVVRFPGITKICLARHIIRHLYSSHNP